jgi:hypothetical protein
VSLAGGFFIFLFYNLTEISSKNIAYFELFAIILLRQWLD